MEIIIGMDMVMISFRISMVPILFSFGAHSFAIFSSRA